MFDQSPVQGLLRQQLEARLRTDVAVDAFCLDYFPTVYHRFSKGMERTEKLNLLLSLEEPSVVATKLQFWEMKHWSGAPSQSWRWLVVALVILGVLTALALYVAVSRLGPQ